MQDLIPVRIINLKHRRERREHILREFADKREFDCEVIDASEHEIGAIGLWQSICRIIAAASSDRLPYVLICEDDHEFTASYSARYLAECMAACEEEDGDVLLGAVSWFDCALPVNEKLYWVGRFTGTQFMIIYEKFYEKILSADFKAGDNSDHTISKLTASKFFMAQPVSRQKYFGYSDVTVRNGLEGRLEELFERSCSGIEMIKTVERFYGEIEEELGVAPDTTNICLPVFTILPAGDSRDFIYPEFAGKPEFELSFIECGAVGDCPPIATWEGIREAVRLGKEREEDVIVVCTNMHRFSVDYSKEYLFKQIISAHCQGVDLLLGGCTIFHRAFPVAQGRYWIASGTDVSFFVIFSKFYDQVLAEPYDEKVRPAELISSMTFHKMLLYPFISTPLGAPEIFSDIDFRMKELQRASLLYHGNLQRLRVI